MSRPGLHPAMLLAGGFHDFRVPATAAARKPCEDCSATQNTDSVERWVAGTPERLGHWTRKTVCCGAERDELGRKPRVSP